MKGIFDIDRLDEVLRTLANNKSRSLLTAFGIFWGIFMLVLLLGGGKGLEALMMSNFSTFTKSSGVIISQTTTMPYKEFNKGRQWSLNLDDVERLRHSVREIKDICPLDTRHGINITAGKRSYTQGSIKGVEKGYERIEIPNIKYGRYINENDVRLRRKVCVIGHRVYKELFPEGGDPCGKFVKADGVYYEIVGVDNWRVDNGIGAPASRSLQIPNSLMRELYNLGNKTIAIAFTAKKGETIASLEDKITTIIKNAHSINPDDSEAIVFFNMEILFQVFENLFRGINILVWMIGTGTLLSGAIGVSNIMLVAIRERTSEIGIRRAIGARPRDILSQILCESFIITILAGLSGIVLAVLVLAAAEPIIQNAAQSEASFQVSFGTATGAAVVLTVLGVLAGIAPAMRALAIKPVDAMRDE